MRYWNLYDKVRIKGLGKMENRYIVESELFGDSAPLSISEAEEIIEDWEPPEGWEYSIDENFGQLRLYADMYEEDAEPFYSSVDWVKVTPDTYYHVIGRERV